MVETAVVADQENSGFRFSWGLAFAGGVAATTVTLFLLVLGSGFGLLLINPIRHTGPSLPAFLTGGAIYFFAAQAFGFAVGGHLAGRLLGPQVESRVQEEFRAAAHGLVVWAVTILASVAVVALAGMAALGGGLSVAPLYGAYGSASTALSPAYLIDGLFWPEVGGASEQTSSADAAVGSRAEASRILQAGLIRGEQIAPSDRDRLVKLVSSQAHIPPDQAAARIDAAQDDVRKATDSVRKTTSYANLWIAFSMLFGAIVAIFAAISARFEDDREEWNPFVALRGRA
jgi:hypothetical protein